MGNVLGSPQKGRLCARVSQPSHRRSLSLRASGMAPGYHKRAQNALETSQAWAVPRTGRRKRSACGGGGATRPNVRGFAKLFIGVVTTGATIVIGTLAARDTWRAQERGDDVDMTTPLHAARSAARRLLDDGDGEVSLLESATSVLVIATVLVAFGIVFDLGKEALFESTGRNVKPVLDSLFGELTLLGFIGLVMFLVERTKSLNGFSEHLFGEGDTLDDLVETVHMALFLISTLRGVPWVAHAGAASGAGWCWRRRHADQPFRTCSPWGLRSGSLFARVASVPASCQAPAA